MTSVGVNPDSNSHFRLSLDLRSFEGLAVGSNVIFRFQYPLFSNDHANETTPAVLVKDLKPVDIDNGFFTCEFATSENNIKKALQNSPLRVDLYHIDSKEEKSLHIGYSNIDLHVLFNIPWFQDVHPSDAAKFSFLRAIELQCEIVQMMKKINNSVKSTLHTLVTLEHLGTYEEEDQSNNTTMNNTSVQNNTNNNNNSSLNITNNNPNNTNSTSMLNTSTTTDKLNTTTEKLNTTSDKLNTTTEKLNTTTDKVSEKIPSKKAKNTILYGSSETITPENNPPHYIHPNSTSNSTTNEAVEYQVAWELTMWKRAEQAKWLAKLQEKETQRLRELEVEWKKQELTREQQYQKRQRDVGKLEKKLKDTLFEVEQQEKRLRLGEQEQKHQMSNVTKEIETAKKDALVSVNRIKDQHKHQLGMARMVHDELKRQYELVKSKLQMTQAKYSDQEEELRSYQSKWSKTKAGELALVVQEKDRQLTQSEEYTAQQQEKLNDMKAQQIRALQQIALLKQEKEAEQRTRQEEEREDVERLRLELLAKKQNTGIKRDLHDQQQIRQDLMNLSVESQKLQSSKKNVEIFLNNDSVKKRTYQPTDDILTTPQPNKHVYLEY